nr:unnamed protein product [Spirometra erinaceieuropaei]
MEDKGDIRRRQLGRLSPGHPQYEALSATPQETTIHQLAQLSASDDDVHLENRWCKLRTDIHPTALQVLDRAGRRYQDWFDDGASAVHAATEINPLLAEKHRLHKTYVNQWTDANKAAFFRHCCIVRHR